jgi:N-acyl homoserine lactone hydrolase
MPKALEMPMKFLKCFTLIVLFCVGCTTINTKPTTQSDAGLKLYVFECGSINVRDVSLFSPGVYKNKSKKFTDTCYLIKHEKGMLLWDSGINDEIANMPEGYSARDGKLMYRQKTPLLPQLAALNIKPHDIETIAFSHFHSDHVGNANAFAGAKLLIQDEEYIAAFGPDAKKYGFDPKFYGHINEGPVKLLMGDYDVFGDGSVVIKRAVGHTPGHQALFVRLPKTGPVLLTGDLYHFAKNRKYRRVPIFNFDKEQTLKSMADIEKFIKDNNAQVWIQHDFEQSKKIKKAPYYYE